MRFVRVLNFFLPFSLSLSSPLDEIKTKTEKKHPISMGKLMWTPTSAEYCCIFVHWCKPSYNSCSWRVYVNVNIVVVSMHSLMKCAQRGKEKDVEIHNWKWITKNKLNEEKRRMLNSYSFSKRRILKDLKLCAKWYYLGKSCGLKAWTWRELQIITKARICLAHCSRKFGFVNNHNK